MSNSEIGGELFITQNTVEYHLRNIYDKCGVRGRRQLRSFLGHARLTPGAGLARPNQS
jgi:DNA-binding CsgD family transcriptional regulator